MARVFLSVGSNMGDRLRFLRLAVAYLRAMPDVDFFQDAVVEAFLELAQRAA